MKILVIRFSSIGDIVLTSPIIRCLFEQLNKPDIHFLTKSSFRSINQFNPYIKKQIVLAPDQSIKTIISGLKNEKYDLLIDLHHSLRSRRICAQLNTNKLAVSHPKWKRFQLVHLKRKIRLDHVVDRYFAAVKRLKIRSDKQGLDFFLDQTINIQLPTSDYLAWSIGASHENKRLSPEQISKVVNQSKHSFVLIGGPTDKSTAVQIMKSITGENCINQCGKLSLQESAYFIKNAKAVLSNDSGMMHIASAFDKKLISFWGCTKPSLGFAPYRTTYSLLLQNKEESPCSKHGKKCKQTKNGCIKQITVDEIIHAIDTMFPSN